MCAQMTSSCESAYNEYLIKDLGYNYSLSIDDFGGTEYKVEINGTEVTIFEVVLNRKGICEGFRALFTVDSVSFGIARIAALVAGWLVYLKEMR